MNTAQILASFSKLSALVIGDICLDRWCTYDPSLSEPSRETGIPRLGVTATELTPGAGGTVASNLVALHTDRVAVLGVTGDDGFGFELTRALEARGISTELMVVEPGVPTFTYTKLINSETGLEDKPRVDSISVLPMPEEIERKLLNRLSSAVSGYDVVLISDQAETEHGGVITPAIRRTLGELAARHPEKVFWADSRMRIEHFRKMIVKANEEEVRDACQRLFDRVDYECLRQHVQSSVLMVTRGPAGALVVDEIRQTEVPARTVEKPVDICGAGDAFSAGASMALAITGSAVEAARIGNLAAYVTIMKKGTGTASPQEILAAEQTAVR